MSAAGVADIIDLDFVAFGNAYFATQSGCQNSEYDKQNGMYCWIKKCGGCGDSCDASCFSGKVLCQHGAPECGGNTIELCATSLYTGKEVYPFLACMEKNVGDGCQNCRKDAPVCAKETGLDWSKINACTANKATANKLVAAAAKKTADFGSSRQGTPWVVVNGKYLSDTSRLLKTVCKDYQGTRPAGCP
eukprot:TRINITY_DN8868_c0_g1_i2.p2 TRINITY_DN8868_c0_g1~~TRINITY_DN8868_c0_g1_i2.p2  ORF type:complete len:190 (+),score=62.88 TRINITY_DN8868_c0_g1_i2:202-771(+)